MSETSSQQDLDELRSAAERVVSKTLGRAIRFTSMDLLTEPDRRNALYRCAANFDKWPLGSFIIKKVVGAAGADGDEWEVLRFYNDWVGAEFLSALPLEEPVCARFYGGDAEMGFFVLEDLGEHRSLVGPLLEGDPAGAEAALLKYATCLGRLHALTVGRAEEYTALFSARLPGARAFAYELNELDGRMAKVRVLLEGLGIPIGEDFMEEVGQVIAAVRDPGPFLAYIHSDPCPDNLFDRGETFRLIDFETGHFGHALQDGVFPRMVFPTCWCANRLPREIIAKVERRYRAELARGCPQAEEDALWEDGLARLCGMAVLNTFGYHLEVGLEQDHEWGIATIRQRTVARTEAFIETSLELDRLPAIRAAAERLLPLLRSRWAGIEELGVYPGLRGGTL